MKREDGRANIDLAMAAQECTGRAQRISQQTRRVVRYARTHSTNGSNEARAGRGDGITILLMSDLAIELEI